MHVREFCNGSSLQSAIRHERRHTPTPSATSGVTSEVANLYSFEASFPRNTEKLISESLNEAYRSPRGCARGENHVSLSVRASDGWRLFSCACSSPRAEHAADRLMAPTPAQIPPCRRSNMARGESFIVFQDVTGTRERTLPWISTRFSRFPSKCTISSFYYYFSVLSFCTQIYGVNK